MTDNPKLRVAYYENGAHCIACAEAHHGAALYRLPAPRDSKGNPVIISTWPENGSTSCDTCGRDILRD